MVDVLPKGATVTSSSYVSTVLPKQVSEITVRKPKFGTLRSILLHDNASLHQATGIRECLASQGFTVLEHPPYSPDLAPCEF